MVKILVINKSCDIEQKVYKLEDESELYKKAGFKSMVGFEKIHSWFIDTEGKLYEYVVYGKKEGKPNHENKYEFPPPIDNVLLFDSCVIVKKRKNTLKSITVEEWEKIYEELYGGFEDIDNESEMSEEEEDDEELPRTKTGYVEDDFVVEDYEEDELSSDSEAEFDDDKLEEDDELEKTVQKVYNTRFRKKNPNTVFTDLNNSDDEIMVDDNSID
jgi:hypothetical protein